ncbi:hypothetical protein [Marinobacter iranensis]|nr:hypothetical protein [Marinobacter iranensis]
MNPHMIEARRRVGIWLSDNCGKPANTLNGVSFAEMMRQLRGEL